MGNGTSSSCKKTSGATLVSVCIPVYNGTEFINETIDSVCRQSHPNLEIIVQDNASTDGTWEILQGLATVYPNISIERNPVNLGMVPNWNLAIGRARGEYVMLLSADDLLEPGFIGTCLETFEKYAVDAVSANHFYLRSGLKKQRRLRLTEGAYVKFSALIILRNPFSINFTLFRKDVIKNMSNHGSLFTHSFFSCDYDLWLRLALAGSQLYYISKPLGVYRVHSANLSRHVPKMNRHAALVVLRHKSSLKKMFYLPFKITVIRFMLRCFRNALFYRIIDRRMLRTLCGELLR
jgi:glycosyltransferase involved in cell wall biosynthesis